MKIKTVDASAFLRGECVDKRPRKGPCGRHSYTARMVGRFIVVTDEHGVEVEVRYSGTTDNRSVSASIDDVGVIGGWNYPHRAMPWSYLVECINEGKLYSCTDALPTVTGPRKHGQDIERLIAAANNVVDIVGGAVRAGRIQIEDCINGSAIELCEALVEMRRREKGR